MTTTPNTPSAPETSVMFSLAELAQIEEKRVQEEHVQRRQAREKQARELRDVQERRRAEETARIAAEEEARARRAREEAAEKARIEARERAAVEVARIEAEAKARLEHDNALRAHELAALRVRTDAGRRRIQHLLAAALGLVLCAGGLAGYEVSEHMAALQQDAAQLREGQLALSRERDDAKATELAALDRRFASLRDRPHARGAEQARTTAEAARNAVESKSPDHDRLRAFADALDMFEARIEALEKVAALDRRLADLTAWAGDRRRTSATAAAHSAAVQAKATGDERALHAYEGALDELRDALAQSSPIAGRPLSSTGTTVTGTCMKGDPSCDLNGNPIF